jgi:hypothetical protein
MQAAKKEKPERGQIEVKNISDWESRGRLENLPPEGFIVPRLPYPPHDQAKIKFLQGDLNHHFLPKSYRINKPTH